MSRLYDTLNSFDVDPERATPMVRQFVQVKKEHIGIILFYRMGDFYETFFEDAIIAAKALEITLTARDAGEYGKIPMAGIPVKAVDTYLSKLLAKNFKVAICEQIEDPAVAKGLVKRKVVRVLSPGTITDPSLLKSEENNFLAALVPGKRPEDLCGLAYCDITTGAFYATQLTFSQLLSELDRIAPSEILVPGRRKKALPGQGVDEFVPNVSDVIRDNFRCTAVSDLAFQTKETQNILKTLLKVASLEGYGLQEFPLALMAAGAIGYYIRDTFLESPPHFDGIRVVHLEQTVALNSAARRNLELLATVKNNTYEGSLLWVLNQTATSMGARLLRQWISQPLTHQPEIESRLDSVEELFKAPAIRDALRRILAEIYDLERLSTKIANLNAHPRDLIALKQSIQRLPELSNLLKPLQSFYMLRLQSFPPELFKLVALIDQAIDNSPAQSIKEGGLIKPGYHQELDQIRETLANHEQWLIHYTEQERERTGIKNLKVGFNNAFGYFIEMSRLNAQHAPEDYHRKQTLTNVERFTTPELKGQEAKFLDAQSRQNDLEYNLFIELRGKLLPYAVVLKDSAHRVAALDVLQSFASVAVEQNYVKPIVDDSLDINLQDARHPVVEKMLPMGRFVPNHCTLSAVEKDYKTPQIMMISGPNMAGKSTYMRQVALITLMAQVGSFVPATYARIGMVDRIFTRVGAVDDLSSGQSTFMVEMNEAAQILNGATRRSLVLLDEVGRGTSTYDGVAIAWGVTEYLVNTIGCRTLFATHYHELNSLEETHPKIQNYRVCVSEQGQGSALGRGGQEIQFLHKVEPGAAQKSYGIQVARMAGVPSEVIHRASSLLQDLETKGQTPAKPLKSPTPIHEPSPQLSLF